MKKSHHTSSFWPNGRRAYLKELKREKAEALALLEKELEKTTDPLVKGQIRERMESVVNEYKRRRRDSRSGMFFGSGA